MKAGETIYKAGELTDRLYVVHRGTVIMTPHDKKADQIVLVKGSYFGEDALLSNEPCLSTTVAGQRGPLSLPPFSVQPRNLLDLCIMCFLLEQIANFMVQLHNIVQNSYYSKFRVLWFEETQESWESFKN